MNENQFKKAGQLFEFLEEAKLSSKKNLKAEFCLGQDISLLEVVASYMALYRFPLLFSNSGATLNWREMIKYYFRPYRGILAKYRDSVISFSRRTNTGCSSWPQGGQTALVLGFVPTFYRDTLRPVAESLASKESIRVVVIGENENCPVIIPDSERVKVQSLWSHWDNEVEKLSKSMMSQLQAVQNTFLNGGQFAAVAQAMGEDFSSFALMREFYWLFWREFKRLIPQVAIASHILDKHRPALIITADGADQRCRIYSLLAREKGIPSLLVQQGLTRKEYPEWRYFCQTAVAVMGEQSSNDMIAQGVPSEKITITGQPGFDRLIVPESDLCVRIRSELGVMKGEKMILFVSQPYYVGAFNSYRIRQEMVRAIVQVCDAMKNTILCVKPHPGEDVQDLKRLIGKESQAVMIDKTKDIVPLVKACDVVVTFFSTVALQAIYVGRPVVNVAFPGSGGGQLYEKSGVTWVARSQDEVEEHIRTLTSEGRDNEIASREKARKKFLLDKVYLQDGQATKRVVKMALNLIQAK